MKAQEVCKEKVECWIEFMNDFEKIHRKAIDSLDESSLTFKLSNIG